MMRNLFWHSFYSIRKKRNELSVDEMKTAYDVILNNNKKSKPTSTIDQENPIESDNDDGQN